MTSLESSSDEIPELAELAIYETQIDEELLDEQPFGIIRLDSSGRILNYNLYEEKLARRSREEVVGKNFFFEVAPCTKVRKFYGRFLDGVERRSLKATFSFNFAFAHGDRKVEITLLYRSVDDSVWVIVRG